MFASLTLRCVLRGMLLVPLFSTASSSACADDAPSAPSWDRHLSEARQLELAGSLPEAAAAFDAALKDARALGPPGAAVAHVLDEMGTFYNDAGDPVKAEPILEESLRIWRACLGPDHPALVRIVTRLSGAYIEAGDFAKADRLNLQRWVDRLRDSASPDPEELLPLLQHVATIEACRGHFQRAHALFQEALDFISSKSLTGTFLHASTLNNFGFACLRTRRYRDASEFLAQASQLWLKIEGPGSLNRARTAYNLAVAYEGTGHNTEAEEQMRIALDISEKRVGENSLRTAAVLNGYAELLRKLHRKAEAAELSARAARIRKQESSPTNSRYTVDVADLAFRH